LCGWCHDVKPRVAVEEGEALYIDKKWSAKTGAATKQATTEQSWSKREDSCKSSSHEYSKRAVAKK
jgi:hypothetical protein